jgi:hypothetical protein
VTAVATENTTKTNGPMDRLRNEASGLAGALTERATSSLLHKVEGATGRLTDYVEGGAGPGLMAAVTGAKNMAEGKGPARSALSAGFAGIKEKVSGLFGGKKGGKGGRQKLKITNIAETIDVGVPRRVAYNQWTQFREFPTFTKKVENVKQKMTRSCTGRRRSSGRTASGTPTSSSRSPTSASSGAPRARRGTSTGR